MTTKHPCRCRKCRAEMADEAWRKKPAVDWDGTFPVGDWQSGRYFWFADDLPDLEDIEDYQLTSCAPMQARFFDLKDHVGDCLPEGAPMPPGGYELEAAVNEWLHKLLPVWQMTGKKLCPESIRRQLVGVREDDNE